MQTEIQTTASTAKLLIIEGNISAGKSTLSQKLGEMLDCKVFLEPTITNPYLVDFYSEPKKWALKMQLWLLRQRFKTYIEAVQFIQNTGRGVILDRSVFSDAVFAEKNRLDGNISEEGYQYYLTLREQMLANLPLPHAVVYLDVPPLLCQKRIAIRSRDCESVIPLEYLEGLDQCYRSFTEQMEAAGSMVIIKDWANFGSETELANVIRAVSSPALSDWICDDRLRQILSNPAVIRSRMLHRSPNPEFDDEQGVAGAATTDSSVLVPSKHPIYDLRREEDSTSSASAEHHSNTCSETDSLFGDRTDDTTLLWSVQH